MLLGLYVGESPPSRRGKIGLGGVVAAEYLVPPQARERVLWVKVLSEYRENSLDTHWVHLQFLQRSKAGSVNMYKGPENAGYEVVIWWRRWMGRTPAEKKCSIFMEGRRRSATLLHILYSQGSGKEGTKVFFFFYSNPFSVAPFCSCPHTNI